MPVPNNDLTNQRIDALETNQRNYDKIIDMLVKRIDQFEEFIKTAHTSELDVAKLLSKLEQKSEYLQWLFAFGISAFVGLIMWLLGHFFH